MIRIKDKEITNLNLVREKIIKDMDVNVLKSEINAYQMYEKVLITEIESRKWEHLHELPAVKKINKCMKSFFQQNAYWHAKNVYSLMYGEMLSLSKVKV